VYPIERRKDNRFLHIEITGRHHRQKMSKRTCFVLKNDVRPSGGANKNGTLDAANTKMDINVSDDDVIYIVAVNSSAVISNFP